MFHLPSFQLPEVKLHKQKTRVTLTESVEFSSLICFNPYLDLVGLKN